MLQKAVASGSVLRPGATVSAIKAAFRAEKAGALVRLAKDVGRIGEKAGTRGALDTLRIAEGPKDVARAARLAESKGGQTRAILKLLGRGALLLAAGAFNLSLWVFSALLALFGFLSSIKATTERADHGLSAPQEGAAAARTGGGCGVAAWPGSGGRQPPAARLAIVSRSRILTSQKMELSMPSFHNGDVEIAYLDEGEGEPIVLVHGFASSKNVNWVYPTWVSELKKAGRRVIALDNRGHGDSGKLYDAAQYEIAIMAGDVVALLDHLAIERADVMGYSLGSRMTAVMALGQPQRLRSAILGGIGIGMIEGGGPGENVALALEAPSLDDVTDPVGRTFRAFADQTRSDRRALAACLRGSRRLMTRDEAAGINVPVLIAVGTADEIAGSAQALGKIIPGAQVLDIPNRDHMRAVGDKVYKTGVIEFLSRQKLSFRAACPRRKIAAPPRSAPRRSRPTPCARHSGHAVLI